MSRVLGRSGIKVSEVGFGCWAIGGPFTDSTSGGIPVGWHEIDEAEAAAALRRAFELGITFFDTADVYGTGHSERMLGGALAGHRDEVVIATKFGNTFDPGHRTMTGHDVSAAYIRRACEESLRRLGTDRIDLYQLHLGDLPIAQAQETAGTLEELVAAGMIRSYGWSTDDPERAAAFASEPRCAAVQHELNVLADAPGMLDVCDACDIASINRGPLAMGLLSGKYHAASRLPVGDVRGPGGPSWLEYFTDGRPAPELLARLGAIREVLTTGGRTLAQGALGWLLARSPRTVPIPGIRTVAQAEQNAATLQLGPLPAKAMAEIARLGRSDLPLPSAGGFLRILAVSDHEVGRGDNSPLTCWRSEVSSSDPTTIGVHRALHEALNSAREARQHFDDGDATPDLDDLAELGTLVASLSESVQAVNTGMLAKARQARG